MSWDDDDMDGAMVGLFLVDGNAIPNAHTAIRQDDPDLAVFYQVERARRRFVELHRQAEEATLPLRIKLYSTATEGDVQDGVLAAVENVIRVGKEYKYARLRWDDALVAWAEVVERLGFRDGKGRQLPMPDRLADLLARRRAWLAEQESKKDS